MKFLSGKTMHGLFEDPRGFKCRCGTVFGANGHYVCSKLLPKIGYAWFCECPDCRQTVQEDEQLSEGIKRGDYDDEIESIKEEKTTGSITEQPSEITDPSLPPEKLDLCQILRTCLYIEQLKDCDDTDSKINRYRLVNGLYYLIVHTTSDDLRKLASRVSRDIYTFKCKYRESNIELSDEDMHPLASISVPKFYDEIVAAYPELELEKGLVAAYPNFYLDERLMVAHPELAVDDNDDDLFAASNNF